MNRSTGFTIPKTCAAVILYHPDDTVYQNISVLQTITDKTFIIDNSEKEHFNLTLYARLQQLDTIEYIANNENFGIAHALNQAVKAAQESHFDYILTFDQDSSVKKDYLSKLFTSIHHNKIDLDSVGIVSPFHQTHPDFVNTYSQDIVDNQIVMTSGNLLNIKAFERVGEFWEALFIDRVDHEYCLRLLHNGYRVIQVNTLTLEHPLGRVTRHTLFNKNYFTTNHSALRQYYQTRNMFHVMKKYKDLFPFYEKMEKEILIRNLKTILFFEKDKRNKFRMIFKGYCDYRKNIFGKYGATK